MSGIFPDSGVPAHLALNTVNATTTGCGGADGELFHSTQRCQPRFDPAAANALMSEILNAVNCAGIAYDCTKLDNLCSAMNELFNNKLFDCLERDFPDLGEACQIEQLVLSTDSDGCKRIARYTSSAVTIETSNSCSVYPPGTSGSLPVDPTNSATYYSWPDLNADYAGGLGSINEALLEDTLMAEIDFTLECQTRVDINMNGSVQFTPAADAGVGRASRVILRIDGDFLLSPSNDIQASTIYTNFMRSFSATSTRTLSAGPHNIKVYSVADSNAINMAAFTNICSLAGVGSFNMEIRKAY